MDIAERVPAMGPPVLGQRLKQINLLAHAPPMARRGVPVLALHVEHDQRLRPDECVWKNEAHTLARPGLRREQDVLGAGQADIALTDPEEPWRLPQDDRVAARCGAEGQPDPRAVPPRRKARRTIERLPEGPPAYQGQAHGDARD